MPCSRTCSLQAPVASLSRWETLRLSSSLPQLYTNPMGTASGSTVVTSGMLHAQHLLLNSRLGSLPSGWQPPATSGLLQSMLSISFLRHLSELICEFRVDSKQVSVRASLTWSRSSICRIQVECIIRLAVHADGDAWFKCTFRHHPDHVSRNVWIDQSMPDLFAFLKAMPISVPRYCICTQLKLCLRGWQHVTNQSRQ